MSPHELPPLAKRLTRRQMVRRMAKAVKRGAKWDYDYLQCHVKVLGRVLRECDVHELAR